MISIFAINSLTAFAAGPSYICVGAVKKEIRQSFTELDLAWSKAEKREWSKHRQAEGPGRWLSESIRFKKILFRWLNGKHLNYSYLDDVRVDAELLAHPKMNAKLSKYMAERDKALQALPAARINELKGQTEKEAQNVVELEQTAQTSLDLFQATVGGWWGGRVRIKELITGIEGYEADLTHKIRQGVVLQKNERALFYVITHYPIKRFYPLTVEQFEWRQGKWSQVTEVYQSPTEVRRAWRAVRMKRQRIFPTFFSKGELGELEERYAEKWAELRSMKARLEYYDRLGGLSPKARKRLDQIRDLEERNLPRPTFAAERWLDLVLGHSEMRTFFFGKENAANKQKIEQYTPGILSRSEREELFRELEIADLASFWGRTRNKVIYSVLLAVIPWAMSTDGFVQGVIDYSKATYFHMQRWGSEYLQINHSQIDNPVLQRLDQKMLAREMRYFQIALLESPERFLEEAVVYVEAVTGERLKGRQMDLGDLLVPMRKQEEVSLSSQPFQTNAEALFRKMVQEREDLQEKKKILGDDFKAYVTDRFQQRLSEKILEKQ